ncbi:MAG TPA: nuclear transport factor 2 family protein [Acidimicrobiales bacterium]
MAMDRDRALRELLDKQAIHEVVLRYCRGIDRCDREMVRDCYWPEAIDEHGSFTGTRDEYVAWVFDRMLPRYAFTTHHVMNNLVEVDGDRARSETYGISTHRAAPGHDNPDLETAFRYVDDFERRDGEWRIARRTCTLEWTRVIEPESWFDASPRHRRGMRDRSDPVYWRWGEHRPWQPS